MLYSEPPPPIHTYEINLDEQILMKISRIDNTKSMPGSHLFLLTAKCFQYENG